MSRSGPVRVRPAVRRALGPGAALAAAGAAVATVRLVDPYRPGSFGVCPSLLLTGWACPGCGSLRMLRSLTDGDPAAAAGMNLLALALVPVLVGAWVWWARRAVTGRPRRAPAPAWAAWAFLAVAAAFTVARNVPAGAWLAPG